MVESHIQELARQLTVDFERCGIIDPLSQVTATELIDAHVQALIDAGKPKATPADALIDILSNRITRGDLDHGLEAIVTASLIYEFDQRQILLRLLQTRPNPQTPQTPEP